MWAMPAFCMTAVTSAKSRLMEAGILDQIGDRLHRLAEHVVGDLEGIGKGDLLIGGKLQPLIGDDHQESTWVRSSRCPSRPASYGGVLEVKGLGDHANGEDAHLLGDVGHDGAAPVLVPPPIPAVMNTMSASSRALDTAERLSSADLRLTSRSLPRLARR